MSALLTLPTVLAVLGISGQLLAARTPLLGWTIGVLTQPLWYAFYFSVGAYPLMLLSTGYAIAALRLLRKELHARGITLAGYPVYVAGAAAVWLKAHTGRRRNFSPDPLHAEGPART
jgi:hypothetical protein